MSERTTPFNVNQMSDLSGHMRHNGPVVTHPEYAADPANFPNPTPTPGGIATGGLFSALRYRFSRAGREVRLSHREDVVARVGELITDPSVPMPGDLVAEAKQKTGWEGVYKREIKAGSTPIAADDFTKLGPRLLYKGDIRTKLTYNPSEPVPGPNPYRPTTWSEKFGAKRLGWLADRKRQKANDAAWIRHSYPAEAGDDNRLSLRERMRQNSMNREVRRNERKSARAQRKFDKIASSDNLAYKIRHLRR